MSYRLAAVGQPSETIARCALAYSVPHMEDRNTILDHLEQARRDVGEAERDVTHQREIIAQRERDGHDTAMSKQLLDQFEQLYTMSVAERDRLEKEPVEASE
jgi:hypothetical protein